MRSVAQPPPPSERRKIQASVQNRYRYWVPAFLAAIVFEGAARKWTNAPDAVMYVIRDAIVVLGLFSMRRENHRTLRRVLYGLGALLIVYGIAQAIVLSMPFGGLIVGLRGYLSPILGVCWLISLGSSVLPRLIAWMDRFVILQLPIVVWQVTSPATAAINQTVDGESAQLLTADSVVRATGTFSAPSGMTAFLFVALLVCALRVSRTVGIPTTFAGFVCFPATAVMIAVGGSRGAVLAGVLMSLLAVISLIRARNSARLTLRLILGGMTAFACLALVQIYYSSVLQAFGERFVSAGRSEDSLARVVGQLVGWWRLEFGALGDGVGTHTNAGQAFESGRGWIEREPDRWLVELGLLGLFLVICRIGVMLWLLMRLLLDSALGPPQVLTAGILVFALGFISVTSQPSLEGSFILLTSLTVLLWKRCANE